MAGFSTLVAAALGASAIASAAAAYDNSRQQKKAAEQAANNARRQEKAAEEANNRTNQHKPDTNALLDAAQQAGKAGASSTMLTGTQGVGTGALPLSKNTLLGS